MGLAPDVDRRRGNEATGLTIRRPGIARHHAVGRSESKGVESPGVGVTTLGVEVCAQAAVSRNGR